LTEGRPVVVLGDDENSPDRYLVLAAGTVTPEWMALTVQHTAGFVCAALPAADCRRLGLPRMHEDDTDAAAAHRVTVDATTGIVTGISTRKRARTIGLLAEPSTVPSDLSRPSHVVTPAVDDGGVLVRPAHAEAAVDLAHLAGLRPAGVLSVVASTRHLIRMADADELRAFAERHGLVVLRIADVVAQRLALEPRVSRLSETTAQVHGAPVRTIRYRPVASDGPGHVAVVIGDLADGHEVPVHVSIECFATDVVTARRCDCLPRLDRAARELSKRGRGVLVRMRRGDDAVQGLLGGSGIGCVEDPREPVRDAVDVHSAVNDILADLAVRSIQHLHNSPRLRQTLAEHFLAVRPRASSSRVT
jgi:3,4-dihydroxy 2-butanone 4-phosphate synthase/GTP cyclohydrolase II